MFNNRGYQIGASIASAIIARRQAAQQAQSAQQMSYQPPTNMPMSENDRIYYAIRKTMVDGKFYPSEDFEKDPYYNLDELFDAEYEPETQVLEVKFKVPSGKEAQDLATLGAKLAAALQYREVERYYEANDPHGIIRFRIFKEHRPGLDFSENQYYDPNQEVSIDHIPFGLDSEGNLISLNLYSNHFLIGGMTGAGKSVASTIALLGVAKLDNYIMLGIDLKKVELTLWEDRFTGVAKTREEAVVLLRALKMEMEDRNDFLVENGMLKFAMGGADGYPPIILVVDEVAELFEGANTKEEKDIEKEIVNLLISIGQLGRNANITLLMMTQNPKADIIPTQLRNNLTVRIAYRTADPIQTKVILGEVSAADGIEAQAHLIKREERGVGFYKSGDGTIKKMKTFYISDEDREPIIKKLAIKRVKVAWLEELKEARFHTIIGRMVERNLLTPDIADAIYNNQTPQSIVEALTPKEKRMLLNTIMEDIAKVKPPLQKAFFEHYEWTYKDMDTLVSLLEEGI